MQVYVQMIFKNSYVHVWLEDQKQPFTGVLYNSCYDKVCKIHRKAPGMVPCSFFLFLFLKVIRHGNSNKVFHFKSCFCQNWQLVTVYSAYLYSILISKLAGVTQKICYEKSLKVHRKTRTIALFLVKIQGFSQYTSV